MSEFNTSELVPKIDSQVSDFLKQFPEYNGSGTVVAILDTGNDANSAGLMTCPDGSPKYLDFIDATGSGDVDTSVVVESFVEDGCSYIYGLSSRKYKLGNQFVNPTGKFHLGLKRAYDLFPQPLLSRLEKLNAERYQHITAGVAASLREELASLKDSKDVSDVEAKLEYLKKAELGNVGPVIDCIVWHNGDHYVAVLAYESEFVVDLSDHQVLAAYRVKQDVLMFDKESNLAITVNFYDDLNTLSIVVPAGSHGTHVAGIVAAYHKDDPSRNGQAPGAKLVSIKIGDTHLGSMETSTGVTRALLACEEWKVDVANMSYGEYSLMPDKGRFPEAMKVLIQKGMVFVTSAGNSGPCLSTMGAPGCDGNGITVGAYLTPDIVDPLYSFVTKPERSNYFWSSRGPSMNGDPVTVSGLGAAVTTVPSFTLAPTKLMNGTSMASPNVCGIVALLISAMKAKGVKYTPEAIKLALQNTAVAGKCPHASGSGYVQVMEALALLEKYNTELVGCTVTVSGSDTVDVTRRSIYLCQQQQATRKHLFNVNVVPKFDVESAISPTRCHVHTYTEAEITAFEVHGVVSCEASWVKVPATVVLTSEGKSMQVYVDPTNLPPNSVHFTSVKIRKANTPFIVATIPITVVVPNLTASATVTALEPGIPQTCIFEIPRTSQNITLRLRTTDAKFRNHPLLVSTQQLLQQFQHDTFSSATTVNVTYDEDAVVNVRAQSGSLLQVCITRPWSRPEPCDVRVEFDAHGVSTNGATYTPITFPGTSKYEAVMFETNRRCLIAPSGKLTDVVKSVQPSAAYLEKLSKRDDLLSGVSNYRLTLEYSFKLASAAKITPSLSTTYGLLYEQYLDGQRIHIFNSGNKLVHVSDAFLRASSQLPADTYTARVELKHNDVALLERLKTSTLNYSLALKSAVAVKVVETIGQDTALSTPLHAGEVARGFIVLPTADVSGASDGDVLVGSITAIKGKDEKQFSTPLRVVYRGAEKPVTITKAPPKNFKQVFDAKQKKEKFAETAAAAAATSFNLEDVQLEMMKAFLEKAEGNKIMFIFSQIVRSAFEAKVASATEKMDKTIVAFSSTLLNAFLKAMRDDSVSQADLKMIGDVCTLIISNVLDESKLALFMLKEMNASGEEESQKEQKDALQALKQCYLVKCFASILQENGVDTSSPRTDELVSTCISMHKGNKPSESLVAALETFQHIRRKKYGSALSALAKTDDKEDKKILMNAIRKELGAITAIPSAAICLPLKVQVETLLSKIIFGEQFEKLSFNQLLVNNVLAIEPFM